MRWMRSAALLLAALAVVASGCGGGDSGQSAAGGGATDSGSGSTADAPRAITIAIGAHQDSLDPTQFLARQMYGLGGSFAGTLTVSDPNGAKVTPGLAESWTPGDDSWTFKLRPNLKFSDGTPLTARDVAATLNYLKNRKDNVNGYALPTIERASAVNDREVEVAINARSPRLDFTVSLPFMGIYPADKLADPKAARRFLAGSSVTAGPYMVKSTSSNKTVLVVNPNYWGPKPVIEQQTWVTMLDGASRLEQVKGGEVDFADDLAAQAAPQLTGDVHASILRAAFSAQFLVMNMRKGFKTSDLNLREAISAALDRTQISQVVYAGRIPAQLGILASDAQYGHDFVRASPDVEQAKALLARSDCAAPCSLKLLIPSSVPDYVQFTQLISQQLDAVGIKVSVESLDDSVFYDHEGKGSFDLLVAPPFGFFAEDYLNYLMPSDGGGPGTWSGWHGADALAKQWRTADDAEFTSLFDQAVDRLAADKAFVPFVGTGYIGGSRVPEDVFTLSPVFGYAIIATTGG